VEDDQGVLAGFGLSASQDDDLSEDEEQGLPAGFGLCQGVAEDDETSEVEEQGMPAGFAVSMLQG